MKKRIEVRTPRVLNPDTLKFGGGSIIKVIYRKPFTKGWFGNFVPVYTRYNSLEYLLKSDNGDVSDPFRGGDIGKFYIEVSA